MDCYKKFVAVLVVALSCVSFVFAATHTSNSPVGYWKTIDDVTGKPLSIIQIWQSNGELMGKIVKTFPRHANAKNSDVCVSCVGPLHNKTIVGLVIMKGLKVKDKFYEDGKILDPENGKTYSCNAHLTENGKHLNVHGYIGMPLFGRSQTWERVDLMSG